MVLIVSRLVVDRAELGFKRLHAELFADLPEHRLFEGLGSFRVKAEEPEKVLARQFVDHEYVTRGACAGLRRTPADSDWFAYALVSAVRSATLPRFTITMTAMMVMMMA